MFKYLLVACCIATPLATLEPIYKIDDADEIFYRTLAISNSLDYIEMCIKICESRPDLTSEMLKEIQKCVNGITYDLGIDRKEMLEKINQMIDESCLDFYAE